MKTIMFLAGWLFLGMSIVLPAAETSNIFCNVQVRLNEIFVPSQYEADDLSGRIDWLELVVCQERQNIQESITSLNRANHTFSRAIAEQEKAEENRYQRLCAALNNLRADTEQTKNALRLLKAELVEVNSANVINQTSHESRFFAWIASVGAIFILLLAAVFLLTRRELKTLKIAATNRCDSARAKQKTPCHTNIPSSSRQLFTNDYKMMTPDILLQSLIQSASADSSLRIKPQTAEPWSAACATIKGNVRSDNQDYGLCFSIGPYHNLLLADGCASLPDGAKASYLAVVAAASSIIRSIGTTADIDALMVARQALYDASNELAKWAVLSGSIGLRTTFISVIADDSKYAFAYIGDGGGVIVRKSGNTEKFLFAQKAMEDTANVLAASLGPDMEGAPALGCIPRYPGDLLICGTDGVFDYAGKSFPIAVAQKVATYGGNLQKAADTILYDLANYKDAFGLVCSDNLTIGLIADSVRRTMTISDCQPRADTAASQKQTSSSEKEATHD